MSTFVVVVDRSAPIVCVPHPTADALNAWLGRAAARIEGDGPDELSRTLRGSDISAAATVVVVGRPSSLAAALTGLCLSRDPRQVPTLAYLGGLGGDEITAWLGLPDDLRSRLETVQRAIQTAGPPRTRPSLRVDGPLLSHPILGVQAAGGQAVNLLRGLQQEQGLRDRFSAAGSALRQLAVRDARPAAARIRYERVEVPSPAYWLVSAERVRLGSLAVAAGTGAGAVACLAGRMPAVSGWREAAALADPRFWTRQVVATDGLTIEDPAGWMLDGWLQPETGPQSLQLSAGPAWSSLV